MKVKFSNRVNYRAEIFNNNIYVSDIKMLSEILHKPIEIEWTDIGEGWIMPLEPNQVNDYTRVITTDPNIVKELNKNSPRMEWLMQRIEDEYFHLSATFGAMQTAIGLLSF